MVLEEGEASRRESDRRAELRGRTCVEAAAAAQKDVAVAPKVKGSDFRWGGRRRQSLRMDRSSRSGQRGKSSACKAPLRAGKAESWGATTHEIQVKYEVVPVVPE